MLSAAQRTSSLDDEQEPVEDLSKALVVYKPVEPNPKRFDLESLQQDFIKFIKRADYSNKHATLVGLKHLFNEHGFNISVAKLSRCFDKAEELFQKQPSQPEAKTKRSWPEMAMKLTLTGLAALSIYWLCPAYASLLSRPLYTAVYQMAYGVPSQTSPAYWMVFVPGRESVAYHVYQWAPSVMTSIGSAISYYSLNAAKYLGKKTLSMGQRFLNWTGLTRSKEQIEIDELSVLFDKLSVTVSDLEKTTSDNGVSVNEHEAQQVILVRDVQDIGDSAHKEQDPALDPVDDVIKEFKSLSIAS